MAMVRAFVILALLSSCAASAAPNPYLDDRDVEVAGLAASAAVETCAGGVKGNVDEEAGRKELLGALGGENLVLEILKDAKDQDDLKTQLREKLSPTWIAFRALPIIMSILVLIVYFVCCWSACPFCRCCRCCTGEKTWTKWAKLVTAVLLLVSLAGVIFGTSQTMSGHAQCSEGFESMACSSAEVLNTTFSGNVDPPFVGLMPILKVFWDLDQQLEDNSPLLTDMAAMLDNSKAIEEAVELASGTLNLLSTMMELPSNVRPVSPSGESLMHECQFCKEIAPPLRQASDALKGGVGSAMAAVRGEVAKQLSPEDRADLQNSLREGTKPLVQFKEQVRDTFAKFIEPGLYEDLQNHADTTVFYSVSAFSALSFLLLIFALITALCWLLREKTTSSGASRYSTTPHRLACCTWCCSMLFAIPALLVGGLLLAVSVPLSGVCLTMSDFDSAMLNDISGAIGMNMTGDQGVMMGNIVDRCIANKDPSQNPNIMDMVYVRNATNGQKVYMREKLANTVFAPLDTVFSSLESATAMAGGSAGIKDSAAIKGLADLIAGNPIDAMMIAREQEIRADPTMAPMLTEETLVVGLLTSARCADHAVAGDMGPLAGETVPGITNFVNQLKGFGTAVPSGGSCIENVACTSSMAACFAGNAYVNKKRNLVEASTDLFRCDIFETALGADCDPINMVKDASGQWVNDCLILEGGAKVLKVKEKTCTLAEFTTYVQDFETRINKVFARLDGSSGELVSSISRDMKNLVFQYIMNPINNIVSGITCGFFPIFYHGMIDGLCYQGVVGFRAIGKSYVIFALSMLFLAAVMYFAWRVAVDNVNAEIDSQKEG